MALARHMAPEAFLLGLERQAFSFGSGNHAGVSLDMYPSHFSSLESFHLECHAAQKDTCTPLTPSRHSQSGNGPASCLPSAPWIQRRPHLSCGLGARIAVNPYVGSDHVPFKFSVASFTYWVLSRFGLKTIMRSEN